MNLRSLICAVALGATAGFAQERAGSVAGFVIDSASTYAVAARGPAGPLEGRVSIGTPLEGSRSVSCAFRDREGHTLTFAGRGDFSGSAPTSEVFDASLESRVGLTGALRGERDPEGDWTLRLEVHRGGESWTLAIHDARGRLVIEGEGRGAPREVPKFSPERAAGSAFFRGRPYVLGRGDGREVHPNDTRQGALGNCYLISAMIATARTDPGVIRNLIKSTGDGRYSIYLTDVGYLYQDSNQVVDREFPYTVQSGRKAPAFAAFGDTEVQGKETHYELWGAMIEKAYAQYWGSYQRIGNGGHPSGVFTVLSGKASSLYLTHLVTVGQIETILSGALERGNPVCMGTVVSMDEGGVRLNLVARHAYVVWARKDGRFQLYNPWANRHPSRPLTAGEVNRYFNLIYVGRF